MVKIINLKKILEGFLPQIEEKWSSDKEEEITFHMEESGQFATLILGKDCLVKEKKSKNLISLSEKDMGGLFFNFIPATCFSFNNLSFILNKIFPLDFYVWPLDHI